MTETKKASSILEARSLNENLERKSRLATKQGVTPADTLPKRLLDTVAGGTQPGERSVDTRRRGARRIVGALATVAVVLAAPAVLKGGKSFMEHQDAAHHQRNIQPLRDYETGKDLDSGMIAVKSGNFEGTATAWVREHAANIRDSDRTQDLIARVNDQANAQNYPGIQPGETFVVPSNELSDSTMRDLGIQ